MAFMLKGMRGMKLFAGCIYDQSFDRALNAKVLVWLKGIDVSRKMISELNLC